jgi:HSP20 family molecular chaperone IbpA
MSHVGIEKANENKGVTASVFDEIKALSDRIRERAFELFERRGAGEGSALNDWVNAEHDLLYSCESEVVEQAGKFEVRMNAPGFDPAELKVTVLPDSLIVRAMSSHTHDSDKGEVRLCEFGQKTLFRRFDLPEPINVDKVTANLEKGVLHLTALKAKHDAAMKPHAAAA